MPSMSPTQAHKILEPTSTKRMTEIRVAWSVAGRTDQTGRPIQAGIWHPDNAENRRTLQAIVDAGNETYGPGTHWIEEHEA